MTDQDDTASWHKTACILRENNCGIQIQTDGCRFAKIRGDKEHVATSGYTCNKALRLDHYENGVERLTTPLRPEADGSFPPIDWDTAVPRGQVRAVVDGHHQTRSASASPHGRPRKVPLPPRSRTARNSRPN